MINVEVFPYAVQARERLLDLWQRGYNINRSNLMAEDGKGLKIILLTQYNLLRLEGFNCDRIYFNCVISEKDLMTAKIRTRAKKGSVHQYATKIFDWSEV